MLTIKGEKKEPITATLSAAITMIKSDLLANLLAVSLLSFTNISLYMGINVVENEAKILAKKTPGNSWAAIKESNL
ncbi:hypothetical protein CaldiYA01_10480 [Caldicellulosiruptor diazotrophicus]|uniref:Uncharacterized protein n=1 Tax=Caldicellulosiruptor diazotrophicus TaxID=2806205 RepID=A0ABN6E6U8_9FIRM|nr:hypothetical protein CaldiYA01_10480 [Caldicellulosiruptor diazotrophicus]